MRLKIQYVPIASSALICTLLGSCVLPAITLANDGWQYGAVIASGGGSAGAKNACITCHGLNGQGDGMSVPYIASFNAGYLRKQLDDYASKRRPHDAMSTIAARLSLQEREAVAKYYASLPNPRKVTASVSQQAIYHFGDVSRGLLPCADCHGKDGEGTGTGHPPLAQQPAAFISAQLHAWKRGDRQNDPQHVMLRVSQALSEGEISQLAAYVQTLPGVHLPAAEASPPTHHDGGKNDGPMLRRHARE